MVYDRSMPSPAYWVKTSGATIVITVSRCMKARRFGRSSATMVRAEPAAKSRLASISTACGVVRSLIPISTAPLPSTSTSPPSMVEG